jgi:N-acyl-D-aspartate/D-glutamate deacylase
VCPGFIGMHAHQALCPFTDPLQAPKITQSSTTELAGLDGLGPAPVRAKEVGARQAHLAGLEGAGVIPDPDAYVDSATFAEPETYPGA